MYLGNLGELGLRRGMVDSNGLCPMEERLDKIHNYPLPSTYAQVAEFVGLCNYYHRFIHHCSSLSKPLYDMGRVGNKRVLSGKALPPNAWMPDRKTAFDALKKALLTTVMLSFPQL